MTQYDGLHWTAKAGTQSAELRTAHKVLECAAKAGLIPLDLAEPLESAIKSRGIDALYRTNHHSAGGNRLVAERVLQELVHRHLR